VTKEQAMAMLINMRRGRFYVIDGYATLMAEIRATLKDGGEKSDPESRT